MDLFLSSLIKLHFHVSRYDIRLLQVLANLVALVTLEMNYPPPGWILHKSTVTTLTSIRQEAFEVNIYWPTEFSFHFHQNIRPAKLQR